MYFSELHVRLQILTYLKIAGLIDNHIFSGILRKMNGVSLCESYRSCMASLTTHSSGMSVRVLVG